MIQSIAIEGLGPHENVTLDLFADPRDWVEIAGRSEAGKSTVLEATCFALWGSGSDGKPVGRRIGGEPWVPMLHDGADAIDVKIVTLPGSAHKGVGCTIGRRLTTRLSASRTIDEAKYSADVAFHDAIADLRIHKIATDPELCRAIMVPFGWAPLVNGEGGGRPFQELMVRAIPAASARSVVAELFAEAGYELREVEPHDERSAFAGRSQAKKKLENARGARDATSRAVDAARARKVETPPEKHIAAAHMVLEEARQWDAHERAVADVRAANADVQRQVDAVARWDADRAKMGERPAFDEEAYAAAVARADEANRAIGDAELGEAKAHSAWSDLGPKVGAAVVAHDRAVDALQRAERSASLLGEVPCHGGVLHDRGDEADFEIDCSTCPLLKDATESKAGLSALRDRVATTEAALKSAQEAQEAAKAQWDDAKAAREAHSRALADARAARDVLELSRGVVETWDNRLSWLGERPTVQGEVVELPRPPDVKRRAPDTLAKAREILAAVSRAEGAEAARVQAIADAEKAFNEASDELTSAEAALARAEALLEAARQAPAVLAKRRIAALGDLGPVGILMNDSGVTVTIDGRPWECASTGRQIVADMWFRNGLRRAAAKVRYLPIFVDRVQDVGGQPLAPIPGPVVLLRTTDGPLTVTPVPIQKEAA